MRKALFSFFFSLLLQPVLAGDSIYTFVYDDAYAHFAYFEEMELHLDEGGQLQLDSFLALTKSEYKAPDSGGFTNPSDLLWARFRLKNQTDRVLHENLGFSRWADSVELYSRQDGKMRLYGENGFVIDPLDKEMPSIGNYFGVVLLPGEVQEYCVRLRFPADIADEVYGYNFTWRQQHYLKRLIQRNATQSFFAGILLLFALVSFFMYLSFKESEFIFFGLLMLSFTIYFLGKHNLLDFFFYTQSHLDRSSPAQLALSGIVLFLFYFVRSYINLPERYPSINRFYFYLSHVAAFLVYPFELLPINKTAVNLGHNVVLMLWVILTMVPIVRLSLRGDKATRILLLSIGLLFVSSIFYLLGYLKVLPNADWTTYSVQWGCIAFSGMLFYGLFDKINTIQREKLTHQLEQEKSDALLFNVLPQEVAQELKETGISKARTIEQTSVLFTDFKSFTEVAAQLTAEELVGEIDYCFKGFDEICTRHQVEKIKTIGDAYMAASGLRDSALAKPAQSAKSLVLAALEMQAFIEAYRKEREAQGRLAFQMRAGIHTGPIVAGVVGTIKFQYDIWGDTVNTASRMESKGQTGKVNISQSTYGLLKADAEFVFDSRGEIEAKGKGLVAMWFVKKS